MGHVDHAHHAEGDGQADGGQQQDRAQAEAKEYVLDETVELDAALNGFNRLGGSAAQLGVFVVLGDAAQGVAGFLLKRTAEGIDGGHALIAVARLQVEQSQRGVDRVADAAGLFGRLVLAQQGGGLAVYTVTDKALYGVIALVAVGMGQVELSNHAAQLGAQAVVHRDAAQAGGAGQV